MLALFLGLYGLFRFVVEFFREPDAQLGLLVLHLSMGQLLCLPMISCACCGVRSPHILLKVFILNGRL